MKLVIFILIILTLGFYIFSNPVEKPVKESAKQMNEIQTKLKGDIKNVGWHIIHVKGDEEGPRFSYTIGFHKTFGHPEIIFIGLKHELAQVLLNNIGHDIKEEGKVWGTGNFYDGILDNFKCYIGKVPESKYAEYVGQALEFYGEEKFQLLQCVYPSVAGKYPWDLDLPDDAKFLMQLITTPPGQAKQ